MIYVTKEFRFEAAHSLPHLPPDHKCHHLHGHSYKVVVKVGGLITRGLPWVMDYAEISKIVNPIIEKLDHKNINGIIDTTAGDATTAENIAYWIFCQLPPRKGFCQVDVYETPTTCASFVQMTP
jgi:6-pyruvoyltetrahydropterin/6-carboxytetrahydropterin synthase